MRLPTSRDRSKHATAAGGLGRNSAGLISAVAVALICNAVLLGCSKVVEEVEDAPAVSDAQPLIEEAVARNSSGRLKLVSVAKTGGRRLKVGDMDGYELWYNATAQLTQDALWSPAALRRFSTLPGGSAEGALFHAAKAGEEVTIPGALVFVKERTGWKAQPDERYQ
jgi:hypothetical protein